MLINYTHKDVLCILSMSVMNATMVETQDKKFIRHNGVTIVLAHCIVDPSIAIAYKVVYMHIHIFL